MNLKKNLNDVLSTIGCFFIQLFLGGILISSTQAQPTLVKDFDTAGNLLPRSLTQMNGILYFSGNSGTSGWELWRSDGTTQGTYLVKDIIPGFASSSPGNLVNVNGTLYFTANQRTGMCSSNPTNYAYELWKSDGTLAGTVKVGNFSPGCYPDVHTPERLPISLIPVGNTLFFTSNNTYYGYELWKTNGTPQTTSKVTNVSLYDDRSFEFNYKFFSAGNTLYYTAKDTLTGNDGLWKTDGVTTTLIKSRKKPAGSWDNPSDYIGNFKLSGNTLYFTTTDESGNEVWKTDGTPAGTTLVKDITPGNENYEKTLLAIVNGTLFFSFYNHTVGKYELWKTNGTARGTVQVKNNMLEITSTQSFNDTFHFMTNKQLWKSDGTPAGTTMIKDLSAGNTDKYYNLLTTVNGTLLITLFSGYGDKGVLWKSNGTAAGTLLVKDLSGKDYINYFSGIVSNNKVYFSGSNYLWSTDATDAGTSSLTIDTSLATTASSSFSDLTTVNGTLYFVANGGFWKSNGTEAGTVLIKQNGGRNLTNVNGTLYYAVENYQDGKLINSQIWKSNGTAQGTVMVKTIEYTGYSLTGRISQLINVNGKLFFTVDDESDVRTLWKSDGTTAGTVPHIKMPVDKVIAVSNNLYFTANNSLWKTDGIQTNAILIKSGLTPLANLNLASMNGNLYFIAEGDIWKTNGTPAGTVLVKDFTSGSPVNLTAAGSSLYFGYGGALWKSNGTSAGTNLIKSFTNYNPQFLTDVNGYIYFSLNDQLWKTNGTAAGTVLVKEVKAQNLLAAGNSLLFLNGPVSGPGYPFNFNLWVSDGTSAGTAPVNNALFLESSYNPSISIVVTNNVAYFAANDAKTGLELWKYNLVDCVKPTQLNLLVQGNTTCIGSNGSITVKGSQTGLTYQAYVNNSPIGNPVMGGGDILLSIPSVSLSVGTNVFTVQTSGCTTAPLTSTATISVINCASVCNSSGSILREVWTNIEGSVVSAIPLNSIPSLSGQLTSFEAPSNFNKNYGQRIRGYVCAPFTGTYRFYIAGDDNCELYLSTDENPANKKRIAHISGIDTAAFSGVRQWNKLPTQKSVAISLTAGKRYYIEALHKEGLYSDHLAVGWTLPAETSIDVLPGSVLSPFIPGISGGISRERWDALWLTARNVTGIPLNSKPDVSDVLTTFETASNSGTNYAQRLSGYIHPQVSGSYTFYIAGDDKCELWFSTDDQPLNKVKIAAVNYYTAPRQWTKYTSQKSVNIALMAGKKYYIEALHVEAGNADNLAVGWTTPGSSLIEVIPGSVLSPFNRQGGISREKWENVAGALLTDIPLNTTPSIVNELPAFETELNAGNKYGQRIRGYVHPQVTGTYTFYIAGDDRCELYLSPDDDPAKKVKIASVPYFTNLIEYTKYPSQKSVVFTLQAGKKYYIEALHKEGLYGDHLHVGWQVVATRTSLIETIPGHVLTPFLAAATPIARIGTEEVELTEQATVYPNPFDQSLTIRSAQTGKLYISLMDNLGRTLYQTTKLATGTETQVDISHVSLKAGVYSMKITTEEGKTELVKIIKK